MPQFFFHLRTDEGLDRDEVGTPFPDLDAAYLDVCRAIPEMVSGLLRDGLDPLRCVFEIANAGGQHLMEVPFTERLTKDVARPRPAPMMPEVDDAAMLDGLFRSVASNLAEARILRRSIQEARLDLAQTLHSRNKPFLDVIARAYGLPGAGANGGASTRAR